MEHRVPIRDCVLDIAPLQNFLTTTDSRLSDGGAMSYPKMLAAAMCGLAILVIQPFGAWAGVLVYNAGHCEKIGALAVPCRAMTDCGEDCDSSGEAIAESRLLLAKITIIGGANLVPLSLGFRSPTGNIMCHVVEDAIPSLECELRETTNPPPQRPSWCEQSWGQRFIIAADGETGEGVCHGDTLYNDGYQVLPYGSVWTSFGLTCSSERTGVTCHNEKGHGFYLSRARQHVF